ncbi:hypothetical protein [Streptomyces sp. NBC_00083]|uniref:hypothetical protein n=1 Tax=Streptomyces sp. NBC_00083 TaxID=2975647 RepID=UPI0022598BC6|nr:hypothetical protein [Streptomyces sp. NBC_00083]MCX5383713.1 hypothetical protein [Streptomyces sp. NBC_00083]
MTDMQEAPGDIVMTRIGQAMMLLHGGDREEARNRFAALWSEIGERGDALHRCTLAHYMADAQDDAGDELAWDLRALAAADGLSQDRLTAHHASLAVRAFYPSLHLNLAADYAKLHRPAEARLHLDRAHAALDVLNDDAYGNDIREAVRRLERQLDAV